MRARLFRRPGRAITLAALGAALAGGAWIRCGPLPPGLLDDELQPSTLIVDRRGETLYEARSAAGLRSDDLDPSHLPPVLVAATLAAEDGRFYRHVGIDPLAMARAAVHDVRARRIVEGGSTITQQVAKLLIARHQARPADGTVPAPVRRGWIAKLREAVTALRLEHRLTKRDILALYLNLAPYGNQVQGAGRAATVYFGRPASTLTLAEAAFLAALPQQPGRFNPWRSPERARLRQQVILDAMARRHLADPATLADAGRERIQLTRGRPAFVAPHFIARVLAQPEAARARRIETTIDAGLQRDVQGIIDAARPSLAAHHAANVAVAVLDNHTGDWLAWEGSDDYFDERHGGAIDGVVTPRQPGSALKPFTYAAAFERGRTPAYVLADVPSQFPTAEPGILYSPRNYDGRFRGPLRARAALAGSENVPAVSLASEIGVPAVSRLLRRSGFTTLDDSAAYYGLGLTLGNAEVRLDELVAGYAMFARGGVRITPRAIAAVDGRQRASARVTERIVSARTAFWITDILSDPEARAYIFGRGGSLEFPFTVAAKTGTSQSYFDNWVVGYTRDVTVGVWVGNFDRTPLAGSSGVTGAGPIFHAVMLAAVERTRGGLPIEFDEPVLGPPAELSPVEICALSGLRAGDACPTRVNEWLPGGAASPGACTWHHASDQGLITVLPPAFDEWARAQGLPGAGPRIEPATVARAERAAPPAADRHADAARLTITRPASGAVFLIDPTLRPEFQALTLRAAGGAPGLIEWMVDGEPIARAERGTPVRWPLSRGRHAIVVRDADGRTATTVVVVR